MGTAFFDKLQYTGGAVEKREPLSSNSKTKAVLSTIMY